MTDMMRQVAAWDAPTWLAVGVFFSVWCGLVARGVAWLGEPVEAPVGQFDIPADSPWRPDAFRGARCQTYEVLGSGCAHKAPVAPHDGLASRYATTKIDQLVIDELVAALQRHDGTSAYVYLPTRRMH